jgi:hypothetical protein
MKLVLNFLPIFLIFLLVSYTPEMADWSHTILGKLVAISIVLLYSSIDVITGVFVCLLIILYYQSDYVESFGPTMPIRQEEVAEKRRKNFRQRHCEDGRLKEVPETTDPKVINRIFPVLNLPRTHKCNLCKKTCKFSMKPMKNM